MCSPYVYPLVENILRATASMSPSLLEFVELPPVDAKIDVDTICGT
jgi:hypothetical protein